MVDGAQDRAMDAYLDTVDEWDRPLPEPATDEEWLTRLEAGYAAYRRMSLKASSDLMAWYWTGCASQERRKLEALRRTMEQENDGNG